MISVRIAVEPVEAGFCVLIGPDVLGVFASEAEALDAANARVEMVRRSGGRATLVVRSVAATEGGPRDEAGFPDDLSAPG